MNNRTEYVRQLTNAGIAPKTANSVADAVIATEEGRERTREEAEACTEALAALFSLADDEDEDD